VDLWETLAFSAMMGFSIYLSLPIVMSRRTGDNRRRLLNAVAIGILVFLMGDVFSDAAQTLYNSSFYGYGSSPSYDAVFVVSLTTGFLVMYYFGSRSRQGLTPAGLALIIALGIGFQNLGEGLVFGSLGVTFGLSRVALVVLVGFILQNMTEGFPIASPFLGDTERKTGLMLGLLFVGGIPSVIGGGVGFYYNSPIFGLVFDGLGIGGILYVILPMLHVCMREQDRAKQQLSYLGIFLGFVIGFLVNLV
jgi:zinc transporter, ZIP family